MWDYTIDKLLVSLLSFCGSPTGLYTCMWIHCSDAKSFQNSLVPGMPRGWKWFQSVPHAWKQHVLQEMRHGSYGVFMIPLDTWKRDLCVHVCHFALCEPLFWATSAIAQLHFQEEMQYKCSTKPYKTIFLVRLYRQGHSFRKSLPFFFSLSLYIYIYTYIHMYYMIYIYHITYYIYTDMYYCFWIYIIKCSIYIYTFTFTHV